MPGYDVRVLDDAGHDVAPGTLGNVVIKLPLPPGCLPTLWNADERFRKAYLDEFPGYYKTADAGFIDEDGYVFIMARTDDIINVAGHRLSTGGMEEVLAQHPDVAECAVIGVADALKGQVPCGFVVLKAGVAAARPPRSSRKSSGWCARRSARSRPSGPSSSSSACRRRGPARSCAAPMQKIADGEEWTHAGDDRRSRHPGRDRRCPEGARHRRLNRAQARRLPHWRGSGTLFG